MAQTEEFMLKMWPIEQLYIELGIKSEIGFCNVITPRWIMETTNYWNLFSKLTLIVAKYQQAWILTEKNMMFQTTLRWIRMYIQSCSIQNNIGVISFKFINKFVEKCQCYYTSLDQSIPLVTVTSNVFLLTEQLCVHGIWHMFIFNSLRKLYTTTHLVIV